MEDDAPRTRFGSFSPVFPVRDLRRALAHYASLGFLVAPYADGDGYGFAESAAFDALRAEVAALDAADGLPEGLIHPDFVLANVVATPGGMVLVDWTGAGRGPRLWSLAFLLCAEAVKEPRRAGAVLLGYREHVTLEAEELDRLGEVARSRPLILRAWSVCMGRTTPTEAMVAVPETKALTEMLATRVRAALTGR